MDHPSWKCLLYSSVKGSHFSSICLFFLIPLWTVFYIIPLLQPSRTLLKLVLNYIWTSFSFMYLHDVDVFLPSNQYVTPDFKFILFFSSPTLLPAFQVPKSSIVCVCVCLCICLCCVACRILVPWPDIELAPPAVEVQSLNHWTSREVPPL